jgi:hypothetical protein
VACGALQRTLQMPVGVSGGVLDSSVDGQGWTGVP